MHTGTSTATIFIQ